MTRTATARGGEENAESEDPMDFEPDKEVDAPLLASSGAVCVLHGLQAKHELNDQIVIADTFDTVESRWSVRLIATDDRKFVKCVNITALSLKKQKVKEWIGKLTAVIDTVDGATLHVFGTSEGQRSPLIRIVDVPQGKKRGQGRLVQAFNTEDGLLTAYFFQAAINFANQIRDGVVDKDDKVSCTACRDALATLPPKLFFAQLHHITAPPFRMVPPGCTAPPRRRTTVPPG